MILSETIAGPKLWVKKGAVVAIYMADGEHNCLYIGCETQEEIAELLRRLEAVSYNQFATDRWQRIGLLYSYVGRIPYYLSDIHKFHLEGMQPIYGQDTWLGQWGSAPGFGANKSQD